MSKRKTPEDLTREANALRARADRLGLLSEARELLSDLRDQLRDSEKAANATTSESGAHDAFAQVLESVDALRAIVGKLAGVDPLP